ncbi:hypothetical protein N0V88_003056 [Collariella sp. IMI 366227]|nr:hypothetical protein N0V88_003056 [Collariella sp. IMI 366227]
MTSQSVSRAIIPLRILQQRTVAVCCIFSILYGIANITYSMLLPTYFQTVHGATATLSGIYCMPMTVVSVLGIVITGFSITAWAHYVPFMWAGPLVYLAGSVLFHLLEPSSTRTQYLGYQAITGLGFGLAIHVSLIAVQVKIVAPKEALRFANGGLKAMVERMKTLDVDMRERFRLALNDSITTAFILPIAVTALAEIPDDSIPLRSRTDDVETVKETGKSWTEARI